jgi:hypothetical protein
VVALTTRSPRENTAALFTRPSFIAGVAVLAACGGGVSPTAKPDLGVIVTGARLAAGDLDVKGTTSTHVAAFDWKRGALAVPLAGGDAQVVDAAPQSVSVYGDVIVASHYWDSSTNIGGFRVWTPAHGSQPLVEASTGLLSINDDSTRILATAGTNDAATTTNIVVAGVDGAPPIVTVAADRGPGCAPRGAFADGKFVVSHCEPGTKVVQISSVDPATGAGTVLLADAKNIFQVLEGFVVVVSSSGDGFLLPMTGGPMQPIGHDVDALVATPDKTAVLVRARGVISRVATDGAAPVTLVPSGAKQIWAISADGSTMLFRDQLGPRHDYGDLLATSATAAATPVTLSTALDTTTFGSAFTRDSRRVIYVTDADDLFVGTLNARLVSGPDTGAAYGQKVWEALAYGDTRVVFTSDYVPLPQRRGRGVLRAVDTASAGAEPTVLATFAGATFALTRAGDAVAYSFDDGSDRAGVYLAPLAGAVAAPPDAGGASDTAALDAGAPDAPDDATADDADAAD